MALTLADYIARARALVFDESTSKLVKADNVSAMVGSGRVQFPLSNRNIVSTGGTFQASVDGGNFAAATLTDATLGIGTVGTAPTKSCIFMYYFQFFTDAQITQMVYNGLRQIGIDPTSATELTLVSQNLFPAACYFAAAEGLRERATEYVKFYDVSIGGKSISMNQKFKNVKEMADGYEELANGLREKYYTRQDRNLRPYFADAHRNYQGDHFQPRR